MKPRSVVLVCFSLLMAQAVFADPSTNCVSRPNVIAGSGESFSAFDCTFYREAAVYPFDLTSFITHGGALLSDNVLGPGYVVWTTDVSDSTNDTLNNPGAFQDVLDFDANENLGTGSSRVYVSWPAIGFPTVATIVSQGYDVLPWDPSGVEFFDPGDGNHTYTVNETLVPEPSALGLALTAGLGVLIVRRRRC